MPFCNFIGCFQNLKRAKGLSLCPLPNVRVSVWLDIWCTTDQDPQWGDQKKKKAPMILQKLFFIVWGIKQRIPGAFSRSCVIVCVVNWPKLTLIGQLDSLKAILDQLQTRRHVSNKTNCCCWGLQLASFPGPRPASRRLQYGKVGEGLVRFLAWVTSWTGQIMQMWASCKPQKTLPARTHWSTTIPSWKMVAHKGAFMSLFTRHSGGQRVSPSQDSEDTQQQFSRARPRSIKVFLLAFYSWHHSHEKMHQALSRFSVPQAMGSWAGPGHETTKVQGSNPTSNRDLFLFWVHSALPPKLSRFSFMPFGWDFKSSVRGTPSISQLFLPKQSIKPDLCHLVLCI